MMGRSNILLTLFLLIPSASLFGQTSIGLEGGLSYNTYHTNIANRSATALSGGTGFAIGLHAEYSINHWLDVIAIPALVQKAYSSNRTDSLSGEYDEHVNTYLQLPVGVSLVRGWGRFRVQLDAGLYGAYWLYGRVKGSTADIFSVTSNNGSGGQASQQFSLIGYNDRYSFSSQRDNRWEAGWWLGSGLQYRLKGSYWLISGVRYFQSLTSQEKTADSPIPAYNRTFTFSIGVLVSPGKPKHRA